MKELKEKGYFTMADGTKSTDVEVPEKKKRAQRSDKKANKRGSALDKSTRTDRSKSAQKKSGRKDQTKQSDDDLDIESQSEASEVQESD